MYYGLDVNQYDFSFIEKIKINISHKFDTFKKKNMKCNMKELLAYSRQYTM